MSVKRTHIVVPEELVNAIDDLVGKRGRSAFIAEAARREVERQRLLRALQHAAGAWADDVHPELAGGAADWVARQRGGDEMRDEDRRGGLPH